MHMEEDDDGTSSQMQSNNSIASSLLYCDEDPLLSTPPPVEPHAAHGRPQEEAADHLRELLVDHMARQRFYAPTCRGDYLEHLLPRTPPPQGSTPPLDTPAAGSVSGARSRGVHYIIYAFGRLGLTVGTVFNAVNYLDRFLSINCHLRWEPWMVELVSVACLSIACKLDEVNIPSLHQLQMEEVMRHSFLPATVRDMELTLLKALQWRLACVTPFAFLHLLMTTPPPPHTAAAAYSRCTRLLIRSLTEPLFIQFDSSVIASSALGCVLPLPLEDHHQTYCISRLIPAPTAMDEEADHDADACFRMMETLYASCCSHSESESDWNWNTHRHQLLYSSTDERPVSSVIRRPLELLETAGRRLIHNSRSAVRRRRLFGSSSSAIPQGTIQTKMQHDNTHTHN